MEIKMAETRKQRAFSQPIYLVNYDLPNNTFLVMGTKGNLYTVISHDLIEDSTCTCPDHEEYGHVCKHIYFVHMRALPTLRSHSSLDHIMKPNSKEPPTKKARVSQRWTAETECPICYEPMERQEETEFCRTSCGNSFHKICLEHFLQFRRKQHMELTCPCCRCVL